MENFISHTRSEIDFTQFNAALVVGVTNENPKISNGVGKSSIFDSICFALYGKVRFSKKEKVIKHGRASCKVVWIFSIDGDIFKIERIMNRKTGLIEVAFYKKEDQEWKHEGYTCDTPTATTEKIESIIKMSYDTFVNCIYYRQNDLAGFAGAKPSKRKETLKEILQIGFWDELQETAKKHEKDCFDQRSFIMSRLDVLKGVEEEYAAAKGVLKTVENKLKEFKDKIIKTEEILKQNDEKIST
jgi:exonuclease SbcC